MLKRYTCYLLCLVFLGKPAHSEENQTDFVDKGGIIANIKDACQRYRQAFVPPSLLLVQERREAPHEEYRTVDIHLKTRGDHAQCVEIYPPGKESRKRVVCKNAKYSFAISDAPTDLAWVVDDIVPKGSGTLLDNLNLEIHFLNLIIHSPTFINHLKLDELLESSAVQITSVVARGDDLLIKMHIADPNEKINDFHINFFEIELFIRPNSTGWLPYRYVHRENTHKGVFAREVNNSDYKNENGIAVPQTIIATIQVDNNEPWKSEVYAFRWSFENTLTDKEFTLSHYSLPEPDFGERRTSRFRYALMIIGSLMVIFALWRMYCERKEQKA